MLLKLALATLGVSFFLYFFKRSLTLNPSALLDWEGILERGSLVITLSLGGAYLYLIPFFIMARILYYLAAHGHLEILRSQEPGALFQRVKLKSELLIDLVGSPALAILLYYFIP